MKDGNDSFSETDNSVMDNETILVKLVSQAFVKKFQVS